MSLLQRMHTEAAQPMFQANEFVEITILPEGFRLAATIKHSDGQRLLIEVEAQDTPLLRPGAAIQLVQPINSGLYLCESTVINRRENMIVAKMGNPQLLQRRRSKRLECDLTAFYRINMQLADIPSISAEKMEEARVYDISMGGVRMEILMPLAEDTPLGLCIHLDDKNIIHAEAAIVRCVSIEAPLHSDDTIPVYSAAVRFGCVPRHGQVQLHRFLVQFT